MSTWLLPVAVKNGHCDYFIYIIHMIYCYLACWVGSTKRKTRAQTKVVLPMKNQLHELFFCIKVVQTDCCLDTNRLLSGQKQTAVWTLHRPIKLHLRLARIGHLSRDRSDHVQPSESLNIQNNNHRQSVCQSVSECLPAVVNTWENSRRFLQLRFTLHGIVFCLCHICPLSCFVVRWTPAVRQRQGVQPVWVGWPQSHWAMSHGAVVDSTLGSFVPHKVLVSLSIPHPAFSQLF